MNKRVIIPKFGEIGGDKYFSPRFVTIRKDWNTPFPIGQSIFNFPGMDVIY